MKRTSVRTKKSRFSGAFAIALVFTIVFLITIKLYQMFTVDLLMKDLRNLEQKKMRLVSETAQLEAEVQRLKNIDRISHIAITELGLVANTDERMVLQLKDRDEMRQLAGKFKSQKQKLNLAGVQ